MLPSCKEVAQLASENIDTPIKGNRWLKMKLHLMMCTYCRRYNKQMHLTQETICKMNNHSHAVNDGSKKQIFENVEANYKKTHSNK